MFGGEMAAEIAAAAAARETKRRKASGGSSFEDVDMEDDMQAGPTDTRARNRTLVSRRPTPPKILVPPPFDEPSPLSTTRASSSPSKTDPPGWNSKWMEQQMLQKTGKYPSVHPVPYRPPSSDDASSFHAPLQSWVPLVEKERRQPPIHTALSSSTVWLQSEATRITLDRSVPIESWRSGKRPRRAMKQGDDPGDMVSHSWAPHLHPDGVDAARLQASMTHVTDGSTTTHSRSRSRKSRDTAVSSSYDGTMIDDDQESDTDFYSQSMDTATTSSMVDGAAHNSRTGKMQNTIRRPDSKVTLDSSIISGGSYNDEGPIGDETGSASSGDTDDVFARARSINDATKAPAGNRVTFVGQVTRGKSSASKGSNGGSTLDNDSNEDMEYMERGGGGGGTSDPSTFLVDAEDTFQVFDEDCNFAPSRGTLCVLCLCIVVAAQGVAIGLYFALR
jgi:hypothetical protein